MGCKSSKLPDSGVYDNDPGKQNKDDRRSAVGARTPNNRIHPDKTNGTVPTDHEHTLDLEKKSMKGDLALYNEAKFVREKTMRDRLRKKELLAGEISEKAMEEKEWLSLTSTRSRATSRIGSPKHGRATTISVLTASELPLAISPTSENGAIPGDKPLVQLKKDHSHKVKSSSKIKDKQKDINVASGANNTADSSDILSDSSKIEVSEETSHPNETNNNNSEVQLQSGREKDMADPNRSEAPSVTIKRPSGAGLTPVDGVD